MQGRVGDGPGGAGAIFVGGLLTVPAPTSRRSFRYDGPRPPPSGQTQPESGSEEEDEEEDGEGEKEEDSEGSGDDSEAAWDPETHGGGEGGDDDDEDHEMDGLEPEGREEEVGEGGGRAATEAGSQHVREGGGGVGVKVGGRKAVTIREPRQRKKANKLRERAYPCTFTGEPLGEGVIAPEFLDEDGGSESSKGTGKGNRKPGWQVMMFGPLGADEKRQCKICTDRISWKQSTTTPGERHFASFHTAHMHVWHHRYHTPSVHLPGETFPRGGYKGVPDGYVYEWPHAKTWPQLAKGKGKATGGGDGSGGIERWMTTKLTSVQLRQAITKLVVTCDLPFRIVEAEAFRELLILLNRNCAQKNFIPSRWTVSRDTVVYAATALQPSVTEMLAKEGEVGCRVSFTIDMWTAPNNTAWLVVTGHWIDENFQLHTTVFEFREIHGRHTGKQMARVVEETVVQWGLETRCLGFTSDNASSNTAAFRWMSEEGGGQCFFNSRMHFRIPLPRARLLSSAHSLAAASPFRADCCATPPSATRALPYRWRAWRVAAAGGEGEADAGASVTSAGDSAVRTDPVFLLSPLGMHSRNLQSDLRCTVVVQIPPPAIPLITPSSPAHPPTPPFPPDPVFLLSPLRMHSRNLQSDPRCTVVVQIPGWSGLANARATIFGNSCTLYPHAQEWARAVCVKRHQHAAHECSLYYASTTARHLPPFPPFFPPPPHLTVASSGRGAFIDIYFVRGFGTVAWIHVAEYVPATPDTVATNHASTRCSQGWNRGRCWQAHAVRTIILLPPFCSPSPFIASHCAPPFLLSFSLHPLSFCSPLSALLLPSSPLIVLSSPLQQELNDRLGAELRAVLAGSMHAHPIPPYYTPPHCTPSRCTASHCSMPDHHPMHQVVDLLNACIAISLPALPHHSLCSAVGALPLHLPPCRPS
ncbi:unnamed protein product [Closterium sp. NIES-65]|nr:unnamed protein product [Closterium sp. NIES-65]